MQTVRTGRSFEANYREKQNCCMPPMAVDCGGYGWWWWRSDDRPGRQADWLAGWLADCLNLHAHEMNKRVGVCALCAGVSPR